MTSGSQVDIYMFKVNNRNNRKRFEICSMLTIKAPERHQCLGGRFGINWPSAFLKILKFQNFEKSRG